jgi:uncharacterized protein (UPF0303 family)
MVFKHLRSSCATLLASSMLLASLAHADSTNQAAAAGANTAGTPMAKKSDKADKAAVKAEKTVSIDTIKRQEEALQFTTFNPDAALAIGNRIIEQARADKVAVTVDITVNRNPVFFFAMAGTSPNNVDWIRRKSNLVNRTGHASFFVHTEAVNAGRDFDNLPTFDPKDFAAHGGSFPIVVKGIGAIGTLTVSGLAGVDDHAMAVRALKWYLKADDVPL